MVRTVILSLLLFTLNACSKSTSHAGTERSAAPAPVATLKPVVKESTPFSHNIWHEVLQRFVDSDGFVDYQALAADRSRFDEYIAAIEAHSPVSAPGRFPSREAELAYYINAYNAQVFKGVLDRGPEDKSVWGFIPTGKDFFENSIIVVGGLETNLKKLEDDIIRAQYEDPRIHAAINCASISCPRLPQEAFRADTLDQQLDAAMREFVTTGHNLELDSDGRKVRLNKIFDWFEKDFLADETKQGVDNPNLLGYINRFRAAEETIPADYDVKFLDYDKGINSQQNKPSPG